MSTLPLPPIVYGPIYPITPVLHLTGVAVGWDVLVTGSTSGRLADFPYNHPETPNTNQWITLDVLPKEGEFIVVEQHSVQLGHSVVSGRSPRNAIQVLPLPSPDLPRPIATGLVHTCSAGISLDGIIPGAWINVEIDGGPSLLHKQARHGTSDSFEFDGTDPLPEGVWLNVWQETPGKENIPFLQSPK
jgi:hypothetical protein